MKAFISVFIGLLGVHAALATSPLIPPKEHPDNNQEQRSGQIFGDSNVGPNQGGRAFVNDPTLLWPMTGDNLVEIPYVLDDSFTDDEKNIIRAAANHFAPRTCIQFVQRSRDDVSGAYLDVKNEGACSSVIGKVGNGALPVNLQADKCLREGQGTAIHMFAHALGFYHEHQRPDRDQFIQVKFENICPGFENEFDIVPTAQDFGITYDFGSITHFNKLAFSKCDPEICPTEAANCNNVEEKPTMTVIDRPGLDNEIGQREVLSILDRAKIRNGYKCVRPVGPTIG